MHPAQILTVKQHILRTDTSKLHDWVQQVLTSENPAEFV
jgi:phosphotransferase system enzyme I (PtsI)